MVPQAITGRLEIAVVVQGAALSHGIHQMAERAHGTKKVRYSRL